MSLGLLFLFAGCERDTRTDELQQSQEQPDQTIVYSDFGKLGDEPNFQKAAVSLDAFVSTSSNKGTGGFTVDSSSVVKLTDGDYTSYTFIVENEAMPNNIFENYVVDFKGGKQLHEVLLPYKLIKYKDNMAIVYADHDGGGKTTGRMGPGYTVFHDAGGCYIWASIRISFGFVYTWKLYIDCPPDSHVNTNLGKDGKGGGATSSGSMGITTPPFGAVTGGPGPMGPGGINFGGSPSDTPGQGGTFETVILAPKKALTMVYLADYSGTAAFNWVVNDANNNELEALVDFFGREGFEQAQIDLVIQLINNALNNPTWGTSDFIKALINAELTQRFAGNTSISWEFPQGNTDDFVLIDNSDDFEAYLEFLEQPKEIAVENWGLQSGEMNQPPVDKIFMTDVSAGYNPWYLHTVIGFNKDQVTIDNVNYNVLNPVSVNVEARDENVIYDALETFDLVTWGVKTKVTNPELPIYQMVIFGQGTFKSGIKLFGIDMTFESYYRLNLSFNWFTGNLFMGTVTKD